MSKLILILLIAWINFSQNVNHSEIHQLIQETKFEEALEKLNQMANINDSTHFLRSRVLVGLKRYDEAIEPINQAREMKPNDAGYHYQAGVIYLERLEEIQNFFKKGFYASKARKALQRTIEIDPEHIDARIRLANYYIQAPGIAGGSFAKAEEQAKAIMTIDESKGLEVLASIYINDDEPEKAEEIYLKLEKREDRTHKIFYLIGRLKLMSEEYDQAFHYSEKSIQEYPEYLMGYYLFAKTAALSEQRSEQAMIYCQKYLQTKEIGSLPGKHWVWYRLAQIQVNLNQTSEAIHSLKQSLALNRDFDQAADLLDDIEE